MDLNDYLYFVHVVEQRGFTAAGRFLGVPKSRLSRHVQQLEDRLGVRLIQRTSRQFVVTDVGAVFYRHAREALDDIEAAEAEVKRQTNTLSGQVRVSCSVGMAQFALAELVTDFLVDHPRIDVIQNVTNERIDLVEAGIDIALRGHASLLPDSSLILHRVARTPWYLFASPAYLERTDEPLTPAELEGHSGLKVGWKPEVGQWSLRGPDDLRAAVSFRPRLCSDDMSTLKRAAAAGLGIVALPGYVCRREVEGGDLVRVLPDWIAADAQLSTLMPTRRGLLPAVKAFADYLHRELPRFVEV
ncbi:MAG TPA: LysR family transcriptional regulator [Planctomycetes bacterium]|nr:LysR family transcriptional regulator [Planctomycetota bacterium]